MDAAVAFRSYHTGDLAVAACQIDPSQDHLEVADDIDWAVGADFDVDTHPFAHAEDDRMDVDAADAAFDTVPGHLNYVHEICDVHHALMTMM